MRIAHSIRDNILGIDNPDMSIYRIFTVDRFLQTFVYRKLALMRPDLWEDPCENLLYQIPFVCDDKAPITVESGLYAQCWSRAAVSDAMWRIYSPYKIGVRVKSSPRKLLKAIWDATDANAIRKYFVGAVTYFSTRALSKTYRDMVTAAGILDKTGKASAKSLLRKRNAFSHEREVRLIFRAGDLKNRIVFFPIEPNEVFESVVFDPRMEPTFADILSTVLKDNGFKNSVTRSNLYNTFKLKGFVLKFGKLRIKDEPPQDASR